jgi:RNA polymerase subunit RPABC4/transcription elongation factor Spt4
MDDTLTCKNCGKPLKPDWDVCPYCQQPLKEEPKQQKRCRRCNEELEDDMVICPTCKEPVNEAEDAVETPTTGEKATKEYDTEIEPTVKKTAVKKPTAATKSVTKKPATKKPVIKPAIKATATKPAAKKPAAKKSAAAIKPTEKKPAIAKKPTAKKPIKSRREKIESIIKDNLKEESDFYFHNDIPPKKRAGAQQSYVFLHSGEKIICLYDSTVFGGAREGICLTNYGIYWKSLSEESIFINYSLIKNIKIKEDEGLFINNLEVEQCDCPKKLKKTLDQIVVLFKKSS